jgi:FkbM family methyltransferase
MTQVYSPATTYITNRIGRKFILEDQDTLYLQRLAGRGYQISNLRRFRDLTKNARTLIDVGANIGNNTIEYATWAKQVKSFEPTPWVRSWFEENLQHNQSTFIDSDGWYKLADDSWASLAPVGKVEIFPYALSDKAYNTEMYCHPRNAGHNHIVPEGEMQLTKSGWAKRREPKVEKIKYSVEVKTLDSFGFTEVDGIKIDVEGWELPVIKGARTLIDRDRPVIQTEMVEKQCLRAGYTAQELCEYMNDIDYVQTLNDGTVLGRDWQVVPKKMDRFWVPKEKI